MAKPWSTYLRLSKKNDAIIVTKSSGRWEVFVHGTRQTSARYGLLWEDAFNHAKEHFDASIVKNVLMLGLAAGGAVATVYESFPGSSLTAIEHDEEMVTIAKELKLYEPYSLPEIIVGDAKEETRKLAAEGKRYELIIVDIFTGSDPSPLVADKDFLQNVRSLLVLGGMVIVNVSIRREALDSVADAFAHHSLWNYELNHFGAFWE